MSIHLSNRYRGKVALIKINKNVIHKLLNAKRKLSIKICKFKFKYSKKSKKNQPPRNKQVVTLDIIKMFEYSAKNNNAKKKDEYSTLYPATNSDSASGISKGVRLVSARITIIIIKNKGIK